MWARRARQLEEKLDCIVTLLKSSQPQPHVPGGPQQRGPSPSRALPRAPPVDSTASDVASGLFPPYPPPPTHQAGDALLPSSDQPSQASSPLGLDLSSEEAEKLLHVYQTQMSGHFPFVVIPAGTGTQDLRDDKPFLFAAVMLAASRQKFTGPTVAGSRLMEHLGVRMLIHGEKSMDLLQGLLVYIACCVPGLLEYQGAV